VSAPGSSSNSFILRPKGAVELLPGVLTSIWIYRTMSTKSVADILAQRVLRARTSILPFTEGNIILASLKLAAMGGVVIEERV